MVSKVGSSTALKALGTARMLPLWQGKLKVMVEWALGTGSKPLSWQTLHLITVIFLRKLGVWGWMPNKLVVGLHRNRRVWQNVKLLLGRITPGR